MVVTIVNRLDNLYFLFEVILYWNNFSYRIQHPEAKKSIIDDNMIPKKVIENKVETSNEENKLKGETEEKTIQTPVKTEEKKKMIISDSPKTGDLLSLEIFLVVFLGSVIGLIIVRKINHGKIFW